MIKKENLDKTSAWPFVEAKKLLRERKSFIEKKGKDYTSNRLWPKWTSTYRNIWRSCKNFDDGKCLKAII